MNTLQTQATQLPETLEDLTQFVLVGKAKLQAYMLKLQTVNRLSTAQSIRNQTLCEAQSVSTALIAAEQRIGELLLAIPKQSGGDRKSENFKNRDESNFEKSKAETISEQGYTKDEASDYQRMARNPEIVQKVIDDALESGRVVTKAAVMKEIRAAKAEADSEVRKLRERIQELEEAEPEVREVEVVPADYVSLKEKTKKVSRDAAAYKADYLAERERRDKDLRRIRELEDEVSELKRATMEGLDSSNLSENVFYFCALSNNFISNVGGLVWLTDRIADMPDRERELFLKAAKAFRDWSIVFTTNLERYEWNGEETGNARTQPAVSLLVDREERGTN